MRMPPPPQAKRPPADARAPLPRRKPHRDARIARAGANPGAAARRPGNCF